MSNLFTKEYLNRLHQRLVYSCESGEFTDFLSKKLDLSFKDTILFLSELLNLQPEYIEFERNFKYEWHDIDTEQPKDNDGIVLCCTEDRKDYFLAAYKGYNPYEQTRHNWYIDSRFKDVRINIPKYWCRIPSLKHEPT